MNEFECIGGNNKEQRILVMYLTSEIRSYKNDINEIHGEHSEHKSSVEITIFVNKHFYPLSLET